jgi:hypothetical protein
MTNDQREELLMSYQLLSSYLGHLYEALDKFGWSSSAQDIIAATLGEMGKVVDKLTAKG